MSWFALPGDLLRLPRPEQKERKGPKVHVDTRPDGTFRIRQRVRLPLPGVCAGDVSILDLVEVARRPIDPCWCQGHSTLLPCPFADIGP